jgi:hypothetical protein
MMSQLTRNIFSFGKALDFPLLGQKTTQRLLVSGLNLLLFSSSLQAGVYTYDIRYIGGNYSAEACQSLLADAAAKFQATSGANIISSGCKADTFLARMTGSIVYSAPQRVNTWSTTSTTFGELANFYSSLEECQVSLEREVGMFRTLSALEPFIAFCQKTSELGTARYRTRIDAVGVTAVRRYESTASINFPLIDASAVASALEAQTTALGLTTVAWYHETAELRRGLSVAYYSASAERQYRILGKQALGYSTLEGCLAAAAFFEQTRTIPWAGVQACSAPGYAGLYELNLVWWDQAISSYEVLKSTVVPDNFPTLDVCQSRAMELKAQLGQAGEKIVGISCGESGRRRAISMEIISLIR